MMREESPLKLFNLGSAINIIDDTQMQHIGRYGHRGGSSFGMIISI